MVNEAVALTPLADAAEFNAGFRWSSDSGLGTHIGDLVGGEVRDNPVLPHGPNTPGTVAWQIDSGAAQDISDGVITFAFADFRHALGLNNNPGFGEGRGYSPFNPAQRDAARIAVENWDELIAPEIVEIEPGPGASSWARNEVDIWLANTYTGPAQAWAYFPGYSNQYTRVAGDVWIADPRANGSNGQLDPGFYGLQTLNHELGHSLGLNHPGSYNFSDDNDGDGQPDPISYTGDAQYFQDSHQFTIMSYFDAYETGAQNIDWNVMRLVYASTPMVDDVYVVQQKYGADMTTRTGDTTYGFNATNDVDNEALRFETGEMSTIFTIWDAGGNDTLDLSGYHTDSVIDLREGGYSSAGGWGAYDADQIGTDPTLAEINENNVEAGLQTRTDRLFEIYFEGQEGVNESLSWREITGTGDQFLMEQNIGIAYGAVVENAIGGFGDDRINGNQADNRFTGGAGDDTFVIADHSATLPRPGDADGLFVPDTSTDTITDFGNGNDTIDLTELNVTWDDLSFETTGENETTVTVDRAGDLSDITFVVQGDALVQADFLFA